MATPSGLRAHDDPPDAGGIGAGADRLHDALNDAQRSTGTSPSRHGAGHGRSTDGANARDGNRRPEGAGGIRISSTMVRRARCPRALHITAKLVVNFPVPPIVALCTTPADWRAAVREEDGSESPKAPMFWSTCDASPRMWRRR